MEYIFIFTRVIMSLIGNDFLDVGVSSYLWPIMKGICSTDIPLDFSVSIIGIDNFLDL